MAASALADLEDLRRWYAERGAAAAGDRVIAEIVERIEALAEHPDLGSRRTGVRAVVPPGVDPCAVPDCVPPGSGRRPHRASLARRAAVGPVRPLDPGGWLPRFFRLTGGPALSVASCFGLWASCFRDSGSTNRDPLRRRFREPSGAVNDCGRCGKHGGAEDDGPKHASTRPGGGAGSKKRFANCRASALGCVFWAVSSSRRIGAGKHADTSSSVSTHRTV